MARFERLFEAFGPSALGQAVAAVVIGAIVGFGVGRKSFTGDARMTGYCAAGGAGVGLLAAIILILVQVRKERVAAGTAKPHGPAFWIAASVAGLIVLCIILTILIQL